MHFWITELKLLKNAKAQIIGQRHHRLFVFLGVVVAGGMWWLDGVSFGRTGGITQILQSLSRCQNDWRNRLRIEGSGVEKYPFRKKQDYSYSLAADKTVMLSQK